MLRKEEKYLDPVTDSAKDEIINSENCDLEPIVNNTFQAFYGKLTFDLSIAFKQTKITTILNVLDTALDYLSEWTEQFKVFYQFSWIELKKFPDWTTVKISLQVMTTKTSFDLTANSSKVFEQFRFIKTFCADEMITQWNTEKISTECRYQFWRDVY